DIQKSWTAGEAQQWRSAGRAFSQAALQEVTMTPSQNSGRATSNSTSAPFVELRQSLASRAADISPFVDQLMRFIKLFMAKLGMARETEDEIEIAILEALANAVDHGNTQN